MASDSSSPNLTPEASPLTPVTVDIVNWAEHREQLLAIRFEVFVHEQGVPREEENDDQDHLCIHVLARVDGEPVGTGRLLPSGKLGRMAVRAPYRKRGVGGALLQRLMSEARDQGFEQVYLDSQITAVPFYERHGFVASGPVFKDAGIDHRHMSRSLT